MKLTSFSIAAHTVKPISYGIGSAPQIDNLTPYSGNIQLSSSNPLITLDYGSEVLGTPVLKITTVSGPTQIELKFTEEFSGLNNEYGDGPWTFSNGLSNTFRTETFNISEPGSIQSFFLQGGFRWQSIQLLTNTSVTFSTIGVLAEKVIVPSTKLPGSFSSSNDLYTGIWGLGGKAVQAACVDNGTLKSTWQITRDGALIRGQETAQSVNGISYSNYTMSFMTKIVRGGTGWRVASPMVPYAPYFILTSNYPSESTFINTDRDLVPPNQLTVGYGWNIVNQSTLDSGPISHYPVSLPILENEWYEISTTILPEGYQISINNTTITTISYAEALEYQLFQFSLSSVTQGTWGFGPFQDQIAYIKDVLVTSSNGTLLYENPMTTKDVLIEYGVNTNTESICLDGSKRDRLVWIGDFVHTARTIASSTNRTDFIQGTIGFEFARQIEEGEGKGYVPTANPMGASAENKNSYYPSSYGITDYQFFFLVTLGDYYRMTGDISTLAQYWNGTKLLVETLLPLIDPISGLVGGGEGAFYFTGPANGTAPSSLLVLALRQLIPIAEAISDTSTASLYKNTADNLALAINKLLWNDQLGTYSLSLSSPGNFSAAGIAFAIRSGVANTTQTALSISKLPLLKYGVGYISDTTIAPSNTTQLSPNILGFLLESLFIANSTMGIQNLDVAKDLLDSFWAQMVIQNEYFTGASWEYVYPDGSPGIGLFTSLSHPWGSAPTYLLPEYVLGVKATQPGYREWEFRPMVFGLGLSEVSGTVPTPWGDIVASWVVGEGKVVIEIQAPVGTMGVVSLPFEPVECEVDGQETGEGRNVTIMGGSEVKIFALM